MPEPAFLLCTRDAFYPIPKINSGFTEFALCPKAGKLHGLDEQSFLKFVSEAFMSKRKTLVNNLKAKYPAAAVEDCLAAIGMSPTTRAETFAVQDFMQLFVLLKKHMDDQR